MKFDPREIGKGTVVVRDKDEPYMELFEQDFDKVLRHQRGDTDLLAEIQKCAMENPEMRKHLVPLLKKYNPVNEG